MWLPHQLVRAPGHTRDRSLWVALWWLETFTVHGPGGIEGERTVLTDEQSGFVLDCYAHDAVGRRLYDSAFFSRPKGADKSGIAARLALFEALGPCRFAGFAEGGETYEFLGETYVYAPGEPMGKPVVSPVVRVAATEEMQLRIGMWASILANFNHDNAPLGALKAYGLEAGVSRVDLPGLFGGGFMLASTAGSSSKDGGKETFYVADETHLYYTRALRDMHDTIVRNVDKRKNEGAWYLETTTMYAPGQGSVAEDTYNTAALIEQGKTARARLLFDHRFGVLVDGEGRTVELGPASSQDELARMELALRAAITDAYGDAVLWADVEGKVDSALDPRREVVSTMRYFLNAVYDVKSQWLPNAHIEAALELGKGVSPLVDGEQVVLGFDGSVNHDATAVVVCRVDDGALFLWHLQQEPDSSDRDDWAVDREAVDASVRDAMKRFDVVGMFGDPPFWREYLDSWVRDFGEGLLVSAGTHKIEWWTKNIGRMHEELERFRVAVADGSVPFVDCSGGRAVLLGQHFRNARVRERGERYILGKESAKSPKKIDAAMAAVLAYACRAKFLWRGEEREAPKPVMVPIRVR